MIKNSKTDVTDDHTSKHLNIALAGVVTLQLCLYLYCLSNECVSSTVSTWHGTLHLLALLILVGIVCWHQVHHTSMSRKTESSHEQLEAMISMLSTVKHKLNNDMQVVLGNAELAQVLLNAGGNVAKPVQNISDAANDAIERIEQLTVIGSTRGTNPKSIDLNATLRESMARLATEMPSIVNLRLELDPLSSRIIADRYLLSLSLSHLVRQASLSMRHGGEIVVRTMEREGLRSEDHRFIVAEIYIVRGLGHLPSFDCEHTNKITCESNLMSADIDALQVGMSTTKAIVELSGVRSVRLSRTGDESLFAMRFHTSEQAQSATTTEKLLISQLLS